MANAETGHGWMSLTEAATYANVRDSILRGAIMRGELEAHVKPATTRSEGKTKPRLRISRTDVDRYIREYWPLATAETFGMPAAISEVVA